MSRAEAPLDKLASTVVAADDLESLVRPLLGILQEITALDSTYLTSVDLDNEQQTIVYARNIGPLDIPEGAVVDWEDTLCRRALESGEGQQVSLRSIWPDSVAARELGIEAYLTEPVYRPDGSLYGTLCGASANPMTVPAHTNDVMALFARLIGEQLAREQQRKAAESRATQAERQAQDLQMLMDVNARCFSGEDLAEALSGIAGLMLHARHGDMPCPF